MKRLRWRLTLSSFAIFFNCDLRIETLIEKEKPAEQRNVDFEMEVKVPAVENLKQSVPAVLFGDLK